MLVTIILAALVFGLTHWLLSRITPALHISIILALAFFLACLVLFHVDVGILVQVHG